MRIDIPALEGFPMNTVEELRPFPGERIRTSTHRSFTIETTHLDEISRFCVKKYRKSIVQRQVSIT